MHEHNEQMVAVSLAAGEHEIPSENAVMWTYTPTDPNSSGLHYAWRDDCPHLIAVFPGSGKGGRDVPENGAAPLGAVDLEEAGADTLETLDLVMPTNEDEAGRVIARLEAEARMLKGAVTGMIPSGLLSMN